MKSIAVFNQVLCLFVGVCFTQSTYAANSSHSALEQSNLDKAVYCMEILESRNDLSAEKRIEILRSECYSAQFIEHSPHISGGREGLFTLFKNRYKQYPELTMSIKRSASEGDLVWLHLHAKRTPQSKGAALIHIFRMKDNMIVEHWGVGQPVPENPKNTRSMF